jgi:hypothetical protein
MSSGGLGDRTRILTGDSHGPDAGREAKGADTVDITVENHGSIYLLQPLTNQAFDAAPADRRGRRPLYP